jgi:PBP1b-binding outer membrane lipoprotein LpoB
MKHPRSIAAAALFLAACSDSPVAPIAVAPMASVKASFSTGASTASLDFTDLTNDMVGRLLPSFDDQQVAGAIETSMRELNAHAIAGEVADAQAASQTIRSSLKEGAASALLLDAMNRTLDVIDRDLAATTPASGSTTLAP